MKKLYLISAILGVAFASPAIAGTCDESGASGNTAAALSVNAPNSPHQNHVSQEAAIHAGLNAEMSKAAGAIAYASNIQHKHGEEAAGWPCDQSKAQTMIAMRAAAAAAAAIAESSKASLSSAEHECECEDCEKGLCTEAELRKPSDTPCEDCVDAVRIV